MLNRKKDFIKIDSSIIFPVLVVLWSDFQYKLMILALTFTKFLCLVLLRPAEASLMHGYMETTLLKELLFLVLADILHKNILCSRTSGGLSGVCTKLEPDTSESNEILEINVLQKSSPHALC